ncbi:MAG: mannitol dehydrogenase family protein [Lautropia sp.]|nr:mannitol dehydrogenase family protein [Lautropia sp.]
MNKTLDSHPCTPPVGRILHLGLGSFHRAHQAVYLQRLKCQKEPHWLLAGTNIRSDMNPLLENLSAQQGHYTLETVDPDGNTSYEWITAIDQVIPWEPDLATATRLAADPLTKIISFTVTEAGYYLLPSGELDTGFVDLSADLTRVAQGTTGQTIYGALMGMLRARMQAGAGPITLLCCDNLRHNGDRFKSGLRDFARRLEANDLLQWIDDNTRSPNCMVDRITPRPPAALKERVQQATGRHDAVPVTAESYIQWVIEDNFANGRPPWELAGAQMVSSVDPYEEAKIRILNATHSCIAWAGTLRGYRYIHEGTRDQTIRNMAYDYVTDDVIPCLDGPNNPVDLPAYRDLVLERFGNVAICDTNQRVAMDGFSKIPGFIAPTIRERLARQESIAAVAVLPALFFIFLTRWHEGKIPYDYQDQGMDPASCHAMMQATDPLAAFCADLTLWSDLASNPTLVDAMRQAVARVKNEFIKP